MEIYFINTDAKFNSGISLDDAWIERGIARTSGPKKYRDALERIEPTDLIAIYVNRIGIVAIGVPNDLVITDVTHSTSKVNPLDAIEYHIKVDWLVDLRKSPISGDELKSLGAPPVPATVRKVGAGGKPKIATKFAQLLSEHAPETDTVALLIHSLSGIGLAASAKPVPKFQPGRTYNRKKDIHIPYGGNPQSGISSSGRVDAIFLFTSKTGEQYGYVDGYALDEHGRKIFQYTGEGQTGDMEFVDGNRAILEHSGNAKALHLFRSLGKGKDQQYIGEFVYAGHHFKEGKDKVGNQRKLIIFELLPIDQLPLLETDSSWENVTEISPILSLPELRAKAIEAANSAGMHTGQSATKNLYKRSKAVKDYVLFRANGICESCKEPSPFQRPDGSPYLEPHHTTRLSDGGPDHPKYVGAICSDCHSEIHYGMYGAEKNVALQNYLAEIEA
jgi:5-methylcytosine-specific restriction protein A